jgi:hypothetical protein
MEQEFWKLHHDTTRVPDHLYASSNGRVMECRFKVENKIGRYLKPIEIIHHHYNRNGSATLVLCSNKVYHDLLHTRELALRMCGYANWRMCTFCKQYDNLKNMSNNSLGIYHKLCASNSRKEWMTKCQ